MSEVWAGMATLRDRAGLRAIAVTSLLPQVDRLIVADGETRGDQAKFLAVRDAPDDAIFLGVDDDLFYPPDYVENIVAGLERHPGCIVSFHGWTMNQAGERIDNYRCLEAVWDDVDVHVAGTGVCAFRIETIRPLMADFESVNADVWLALRAEERRIRRVVLSHPSFWLGYGQMPMARTVYTHTAYETGTPLDSSAGRNRAVALLADLLYRPEAAA